jgi:hypothetical protein
MFSVDYSLVSVSRGITPWVIAWDSLPFRHRMRLIPPLLGKVSTGNGSLRFMNKGWFFRKGGEGFPSGKHHFRELPLFQAQVFQHLQISWS